MRKGQGGLEVDEHQDGLLHPAAELRGQEAERGAEHGGHGGGAEGDQQRDADADDQPGEDVAAQLVRAEPMRRVAAEAEGWGEAVAKVELCDAVRAELFGEHGDEQDGSDPGQCEDDQDWPAPGVWPWAREGTPDDLDVGHQRATRRRGSKTP